VRSGRLIEIESLRAHVNGNTDLTPLSSRDIAGEECEERARNCGDAKDGPGTQDRRVGGHADLLVICALSGRFIDNECSGEKLDTSESGSGLWWSVGGGRARARRKFWLPISNSGTLIPDEVGNLMHRHGCG
jgi:hypothetical protein